MMMAVERREQQQHESRKAIFSSSKLPKSPNFGVTHSSGNPPRFALFVISQLCISHQSHNHSLFITVSKNYHRFTKLLNDNSKTFLSARTLVFRSITITFFQMDFSQIRRWVEDHNRFPHPMFGDGSI